MQHVIVRKEPKFAKWKIGVFDIETKPVNGESSLIAPFNMAATTLDGAGEDIRFWYYPVFLLEYMLSFGDGVRWFCHNGGGFDFKYIVADKDCQKFLAKEGYTLAIIGGDIPKALMIKRGKKTILICDSMKLLPSSLADLGKSFGTETQKLSGTIDFEGGETFDKDNELHVQYLVADVLTNWQVVDKYRHILNTEFGQELKCTASSTAFDAWSKTITEDVYHHCNACNDFARKAYYGGRTECFIQGIVKNANYIDVNSLYAYIMYEYGGLHKPCYVDKYDDTKRGFYRIRAIVPTSFKFGPLPYRKPDRTGVLFPVGRFETCASSLEIDLACEMGCYVEVLEGWVFDEWDKDLFKPFINKCMTLRAKDYYGAMGVAAKFLQNNLYGFFGMNPERTEVLYSHELPDDETYEPMLDDSTGSILPGFWTHKKIEETVNCIPAFAAWITSAARCYLLRAILAEELAGNTVVYCDTDSLILLGDPVSWVEEGTYGAFKWEWIIDEFTGITSKTYRMNVREPGKPDVKMKMKCKGIPKRKLKPEMYDVAMEGGKSVVEFLQMNSLNRVIKSGKFGNEHATRTIPNVESITTRNRALNGLTVPKELNLW